MEEENLDEEINPEELIEVSDEELAPLDDNDIDNDIENEGEDEMVESEEVEIQPSTDDAFFTFTEHTDSVYCVAIHPSDPSLIATGNVIEKKIRFSNLLC